MHGCRLSDCFALGCSVEGCIVLVLQGPVVWGSHFQERILVHDHKLRTAIGQFAELGPDAVGLSEDAYEAMLAKVCTLFR
jgi:hypothetical protein